MVSGPPRIYTRAYPKGHRKAASPWKLVLLRHGESKWNLENKFTGWKDVELTKKGEKEAKNAGELIKNEKFSVDIRIVNCGNSSIQLF